MLPPVTRARWWLLGAILVVGAVLRRDGIGAHLSDAEGYSYLVGSAPSAGAFLHRLAAYENTPPLFYLLLTPLPLGHTAWLRVQAAIPGALIPLALYAAVRRPLGRARLWRLGSASRRALCSRRREGPSRSPARHSRDWRRSDSNTRNR